MSSSSSTIRISKERLDELEYIEKNYSTIIAKCATEVILSLEQTKSNNQKETTDSTSSKAKQNQRQ